MNEFAAKPRTKLQSLKIFWPLMLPFVLFGVVAGAYLARPSKPQPLYSVSDYSVQLSDGTLLTDPAEVTIPLGGQDRIYRKVCSLVNARGQLFKTFKDSVGTALFQADMVVRMFPVGCFVREGLLKPLPGMLVGHAYAYMVFVSLINGDGSQTIVVMPGPIVHVGTPTQSVMKPIPPEPARLPDIVTERPGFWGGLRDWLLDQ